MTVAQIKRPRKEKMRHLREYPAEGTMARQIMDLLLAGKGAPVAIPVSIRAHYRSNAIRDLQNFYGLDIRQVGRGRGDIPATFVLAGEWFGRVYIDYIAERIQGADA